MKVGIDSVEVKRIKKLLDKHNNLDKIYSNAELNNIYACNHSYLRASGYFAVKEAFLKALGIGINGEIKLNEISVAYTNLGAPQIEMSEQIKNMLNKYNFSSCEISITHTTEIATAVCILN